MYCTCVAAATVLCGHARFCTYNDVWTELDSSSAIRLLLYRRPITLDFYVINPIRLHYCQLLTIYHASSSTSSANGLLLRRPVSVEHTAASGVDSEGARGGDRPLNKNIPGREYLFAPSKF